MHDVIIIGGGPAAITAGIYLARKKVNLLLLAKDWGGQAAKTSIVENYPGFGETSGPDLVNKFVEQLKKYKIEIKENTEVKEFKLIDDLTVEAKADGHTYQAKTAVIATGGVPRKLNVPGEKEFVGKGVAYCSICDAPLFKNKEVAVVGGGNAGLEAVLDLLKYASKIYLLEFQSELGGDAFLRDRIKGDGKVEIIMNAAVKEIKGDKLVSGLVYQDRQSGQTKELSLQGVFVTIGWSANSSLFENVVKLNEKKEIEIDNLNKTSKPNIFAAGDVTNVLYKQLVIAVGEGAKAALSTYNYISSL